MGVPPMGSETTGQDARSFTGETPVPHPEQAADFTSSYTLVDLDFEMTFFRNGYVGLDVHSVDTGVR